MNYAFPMSHPHEKKQKPHFFFAKGIELLNTSVTRTERRLIETESDNEEVVGGGKFQTFFFFSFVR